MTASAPQPVTARPPAREMDFPLPEEIDYSCRWSVGHLLFASVVWLVVSLVFAVFASVKLHAPGMAVHIGALTYGRVAAVASSTFLYGFASQAAIGIALWLFARMGHTFLVLPRAGVIAGILWNVGVLLGSVGILAGSLTQFPAYAMPPWTTWMFLVAFVILGLSGLLTYVARTDRDVYPSNWFLFAGFFALPWVLSVAYLLLGRFTVRGVMEPVIGTWFSNNFFMLWLGPVALAIIFYFVSKLSLQPLYSNSMAIFSFWFYLIFATGSGFQNIAGLPNWMPNLSSVCNTLMLIPAAVIVINWNKTWTGHGKAQKAKDRSSKYVAFAGFGFIVAIVLNLILSCPQVDEVVGLTIFKDGARTWFLYGFVGMALFAAIHHIMPRLSEVDWPSSGLASAHYGLTVAGIIVTVAAFLLGGYVQGNAINSPDVPFNGQGGVAGQTIPYLGISTVGWLLLLIGQLALLANVLLMGKSSIAACCGMGATKEVVR